MLSPRTFQLPHLDLKAVFSAFYSHQLAKWFGDLIVFLFIVILRVLEMEEGILFKPLSCVRINLEFLTEPMAECI